MNNLTSKHLADLRNSTLTDETISTHGIVSLSEEETQRLLKRSDISGDGLMFPFPKSHLCRVKLDKPLGDAKYLNPKGVEIDLYIPHPTLEKLNDVSIPLYFVEGEKKALALCQLGYAAIGLCGVWGWRSKGCVLKGIVNLFLKNRVVVIVFDSDKYKNSHIAKAEYNFALYLRKREAIVKIVNLDVALGKGVDDQIKDFLAKGNIETLKKEYLEAPVSYEDYIAKHRETKSIASKYTDYWNAEKLVELYGKDFRWCQELKSWFVWSGKVWKKDPGGLYVERLAKKMTKEMMKSQNEELLKHAKDSQNKYRLAAMVELAKSEEGIEISTSELDNNGYLLNCDNCTIDLRTGEPLPHNKEHYLTRIIKTKYDPKAQCPRWIAFLEKIFPGKKDIINFLQRVAGYCLTDSTGEHCIFILYGTGRNGKNTFLDTIRMILGEYATVTGTETLMIKRENGGGPSEHLARLWGRRLVMASESDEKNSLSEATIKKLSGDRTVCARFLHANSFEYCPTYKIFLVTNYKPAIHGTDEGIWSKIKLIPFEEKIPKEERVMDYDKILLNEEAPGILRWMIEGCIFWQKDGLGIIKEIEEATNKYREDEDFFGGFLKDTTISKDHLEASSFELYALLKQYCVDNGRHYPSQQKFAKYLESKGFKKTQRSFGLEKGRMFWKGLGISSSTGLASEGDSCPILPLDEEQ
jgi:P4 family phage/plasmid primase-like protien